MHNIKIWLMATRPKTLTAAIVPVLVATFLAKATHGHVSWLITLFALITAFCIQIGTNFINDALDFKKGADTQERLGPVRVTQSGLLTMQQVHLGGMLFFGAALMFGMPLVQVGGWPILVLLILSVIFGYLYTGGPMPLAYYGLGDLFVILFFGFASVVAVYYLQTGEINSLPFLAGAQVGLLSTVLIAINNLRDHVQDAKANKRTLAVRFGKTFSRIEISALIIAAFLLSFGWIFERFFLVGLLPLATLPLGILIIKNIWQVEPGKEYNAFLGQAAGLHLAFGILMCIGFSL